MAGDIYILIDFSANINIVIDNGTIVILTPPSTCVEVLGDPSDLLLEYIVDELDDGPGQGMLAGGLGCGEEGQGGGQGGSGGARPLLD